MKKIIPALALLLISAMVLASASYAWFSMNTSVTATGMQVKAKTSSTLLIDTAIATNSEGRLEQGDSTKAALVDSSAINPTSTVDGTNWFTAEAALASAKTAKEGTFEDVTGSAALYRLANTFYLQAFDQTKAKSGTYDAFEGKKIVVDEVTVSAPDGDDLAPSFRILVVCGDEKVFIAPIVTTEPTNQGVASVSSAGVATMDTIQFADVSARNSNKSTVSTNNTVVAADDLNYNEVYTVNVYIYFDGEDTSLFTDNIPETLDNYTVTIQFSLADAA